MRKFAAFSSCKATTDYPSRCASIVRCVVGTLLLIATLAALSLSWWVLRFEVVVVPQSITHDQGSSYIAPVSFPIRFPLSVTSDVGSNNGSNLIFKEDGRA